MLPLKFEIAVEKAFYRWYSKASTRGTLPPYAPGYIDGFWVEFRKLIDERLAEVEKAKEPAK